MRRGAPVVALRRPVTFFEAWVRIKKSQMIQLLHQQAMRWFLIVRVPSFVMTGSQVRVLFAAPSYTLTSLQFIGSA